MSDSETERRESLHAFIAGYVIGAGGDSPRGLEAEKAFNRWWNDPSVRRARAERKAGR